MPSTSTTVSPELGANGAQPAVTTTQLQIPTTTTEHGNPLVKSGTILRLPDFLTICYKLVHGVAVSDVEKQRQVARAILSRISHLIPSPKTDAYDYQATGIIFNWATSSSFCATPFVEIVCPSLDACEAIPQELTEITMMDGGGTREAIFALKWGGEALPLDILPFDVLGPQVPVSDLKAFFNVLKEAMAPLGSLTGPLNLMFTQCEGLEVSNKVQKVARGYVRLSTSSMQLSLEQLVDHETKLLQWVGAPPVMYVHRHLECYRQWAAHKAHGGVGDDETATSGGQGEANGASKKRKTGSQ